MRRVRVLTGVFIGCFVVAGISFAGCGGDAVTNMTASTMGTIASASVVSVEPPAGWAGFTGGGADIYLPPAFDLDLLDAKTAATLRAWGPNWEETAKALETEDHSKFLIYVADSASRASGSLTSVDVVREKTEVKLTLKEYVDATLAQTSGRVASRTDLLLNGYKATRLAVEQATFSQLMYVVKGPSGFWAVAYTTVPAEFQSRLTDFETSAATFHPGP